MSTEALRVLIVEDSPKDAPLRNIEGFSKVLVRNYASHLDKQARVYLDWIQEGCQQMQELIDALLKLAKLTRTELKREPINLSQMAREIMDDLQKQGSGRSIEFKVQDALLSVGDYSLVRLVLYNLLDNALKFTVREEKAVIELGAKDCDGSRVFFVKDNGTGFDMKYVDRLFGAFQRLHSSEEFPGNGIGLATVRRIINRHGGRVWAEGKPGGGVRVFFTLD